MILAIKNLGNSLHMSIAGNPMLLRSSCRPVLLTAWSANTVAGWYSSSNWHQGTQLFLLVPIKNWVCNCIPCTHNFTGPDIIQGTRCTTVWRKQTRNPRRPWKLSNSFLYPILNMASWLKVGTFFAATWLYRIETHPMLYILMASMYIYVCMYIPTGPWDTLYQICNRTRGYL